jgi:hypothetical protein
MSPLWFTAAKTFIQKRPLVFNGAIGGVVLGTSDGVAQTLENSSHQLQWNSTAGTAALDNGGNSALSRLESCWEAVDGRRMIAATMLGILFGGVIYPMAYAKLDKIWYKKDFRSLLSKSLVEIFSVGIFVNSLSMLGRGVIGAGHTVSETVQHVRDELVQVTLNDIKVWLPYNLLAFSIIPPWIRPTTTAFMEAMWQTYISLRANDYCHCATATEQHDKQVTTTITKDSDTVLHSSKTASQEGQRYGTASFKDQQRQVV